MFFYHQQQAISNTGNDKVAPGVTVKLYFYFVAVDETGCTKFTAIASTAIVFAAVCLIKSKNRKSITPPATQKLGFVVFSPVLNPFSVHGYNANPCPI